MGGLFRNVVLALLGLAFLVLAFLLIIYVLGMLGIVIPAQIMNVIYVIGLLIGILFIYDTFFGGKKWFFPQGGP